ncbi:glycosyltransferase [Iris pallida]|uniref:Glycosyltransferase n=1 Tax=Iris pallida TaxID=29817 RepID=A0AAX6IJU6_IRIPA|nr:glycosyltransferase [Iris pallida]
MKNLTKFQDQKVGLMLVACFLASMLFLVLSKANNDISLRILTPKSSLVAVSAGLKADDKTDSVDGGNGTSPLCDVAQPRSEFCEMDATSGSTATPPPSPSSRRRRRGGRGAKRRVVPHQALRPQGRRHGDELHQGGARQTDSADEPPPRCTVNHTDTPAIVFSTSAYPGTSSTTTATY